MSVELVIFWMIFFFILGFSTAYIIFRLREERKEAGKVKTETPGEQTAESEARQPAKKVRVWVEVDGKMMEAEIKDAGRHAPTAAVPTFLSQALAQPKEQPFDNLTTAAAQPAQSNVLITPPPAGTATEPAAVTPISPLRDPINTLLKAVQPRDLKLAGPPKSIVSQIEEVLQEQLVDDHLLERRIHLVETPDHGMAVRVGLDYYESVDAVPDEETRGLLRRAIKEWEYRNLKGKP